MNQLRKPRSARLLMGGWLIVLSLVIAACGDATSTPASATTAAVSTTSASIATTVAGATSATTSAATTAVAASGQPVELRIAAYNGEAKQALDTLDAAFEKANPNIKVKLDMIPTDQWTQYRTARLTNGDVDILFGEPKDNLKTAQDRGNWLDQTGQAYLGQVDQAALKYGQADNAQYMAPISTISFPTYYNKKIFTDLGLSVPKTWSDFIAACEKIKASGKTPIVFGGKPKWPMAMIIASIEPSIVRVSDPTFYDDVRTEKAKFSDAGWVEVLSKAQSLGKYFEDGALGVDYPRTYSLFAQGEGAMLIDGSWSLGQVLDAQPTFDTGVFFLPGSDKAEDNAKIGTKSGGGWYIYKKSPNIAAAQKWLSFFYQKDTYQQFIDTTRLFPVVSGTKMKDPLAQEALTQLQQRTQIAEFEDLIVPGSKFDANSAVISLISTSGSAQQAAQQIQSDFIASKPQWDK